MNDVKVGRIALTPDALCAFDYDPAYLVSGESVSPFNSASGNFPLLTICCQATVLMVFILQPQTTMANRRSMILLPLPRKQV